MLTRGLLDLLSPGGARGGLSILIFHRVFAEPDPLFPEEVTRAQFDAICGWLRSWFNVLPLQSAARQLRAGTLPRRAAAITFDDGYADNHAVAAPVLRRHGLPATFFVASGFLDGGRMWNDTAIEAIRLCPAERLDLAGSAAAALGTLPLDGPVARRASIDRVLKATKHLPPEQRTQWIDAIAERANVALPDDLMMTSAQVADLARQGMTIGAHTITHPILTRIDADTLHAEIDGSRRRLREITGDEIALFAYPNGKPEEDYDRHAVEAVRALGFEAAVSTRWGSCGPREDPFQLPRFTPWDRGRTAFALRMAGNLLRRH